VSEPCREQYVCYPMKLPAGQTRCRKTRRSSSTVLDPMKPPVPVWHNNFRNSASHVCDLCRAALAAGRTLGILWPMLRTLLGQRRCADVGCLSDQIIFYILLGLADTFRLAQVAPIVFVGAESLNLFTLSGQAQICRNDRENAFFRKQREYPRRDHVNAGEGQLRHLLRG